MRIIQLLLVFTAAFLWGYSLGHDQGLKDYRAPVAQHGPYIDHHSD